MSLFERLPEHERVLIHDYINHYGYTEADDRSSCTRASLDYVLRFWNENKENLYNMFGQQFIIERPVELKISTGEIAALLDKEYGRSNSPYYNFRQEFRELVVSGDNEPLKYSEHPYRRILRYVLEDTNVLASNTYEDIRIDMPTPDGKVITFERGCKPMRMLGKIAKAYNLKYFEDFRIWHSQKLNQKALHGTLCLSIHPLDFMTMSDNDSDWTSCMSWQEEGCYRSGTVECMNSPLVIVAYLKSEHGDMEIPSGTWNNKKWRSLFIVHDKAITNVKGYPYRSDDLNKIVLEWLLEMVPNRERYGEIFKYEYIGRGISPLGSPADSDPKYNLEFVTGGHMYNDFGSEMQMGVFVDSEIPEYSKSYSRYDILQIDYSGPSVCVHCGMANDMPDDETELVCINCSYETVCECCECHLARDEYYTVDGRVLCYNCYDDHTCTDPITGERHYEYDMVKLYLVPDKSNVEHFSGSHNWDSLAYILIDEHLFDIHNPKREYGEFFTRDSDLDCTKKWWSSWHYVRPSDLTEDGLNLFKDCVLYDIDCESFEEYYTEADNIIRNGSN